MQLLILKVNFSSSIDPKLVLSQQGIFTKNSFIYTQGEDSGEVIMTAKASSIQEGAHLVMINIDKSQKSYWTNNKVLDQDLAYYDETGEMYETYADSGFKENGKGEMEKEKGREKKKKKKKKKKKLEKVVERLMCPMILLVPSQIWVCGQLSPSIENFPYRTSPGCKSLLILVN
jgi:hypothetical protein